MVNALRSETIWPANVEHCPQSWTLGQNFLEKLLLIRYTCLYICKLYCSSRELTNRVLRKTDAHDLSLEHLMLFKEVTDQGKLQYDHIRYGWLTNSVLDPTHSGREESSCELSELPELR